MNLTWNDGIGKYPTNTFQIPVTRMEYESGLRGMHCIYYRQSLIKFVHPSVSGS
jgi:hypothetical protein